MSGGQSPDSLDVNTFIVYIWFDCLTIVYTSYCTILHYPTIKSRKIIYNPKLIYPELFFLVRKMACSRMNPETNETQHDRKKVNTGSYLGYKEFLLISLFFIMCLMGFLDNTNSAAISPIFAKSMEKVVIPSKIISLTLSSL